MIQRVKETKDDIHQFKTKLTKAQTRKLSESKVPTGKSQLGKKANKTKPTNMVKNRTKRKKE